MAQRGFCFILFKTLRFICPLFKKFIYFIYFIQNLKIHLSTFHFVPIIVPKISFLSLITLKEKMRREHKFVKQQNHLTNVWNPARELGLCSRLWARPLGTWRWVSLGDWLHPWLRTTVAPGPPLLTASSHLQQKGKNAAFQIGSKWPKERKQNNVKVFLWKFKLRSSYYGLRQKHHLLVKSLPNHKCMNVLMW